LEVDSSGGIAIIEVCEGGGLFWLDFFQPDSHRSTDLIAIVALGKEDTLDFLQAKAQAAEIQPSLFFTPKVSR
jgi:hypothetical protein